MEDFIGKLQDIHDYGVSVARYEHFRADLEFRSDGKIALTLWDQGRGRGRTHSGCSCLHVAIRETEEGLDVLFKDAWGWLYAQPSPERRELNCFVKMISETMEVLGEGDSEVVRDLYRKLFNVREEASRHLLEYAPETA